MSQMEPPTKKLDRQWWVQAAIADTGTNDFAVTAGLGSGKTHGTVEYSYDRTALNSKCKYSAFVLPTYQLVYNTAIPTFRKVLAAQNIIENVDFKILKSPFPKIEWRTGQETHFISGNNPDRIVGVEYSHAVISEAGSINKEVADLIRLRVRDPDAIALQTVFEGVPQGLGWYADEFNSDEQEGWEKAGLRDHIKTDVVDGDSYRKRRFRLTSYDNPHLPAGYISRILHIYRNRPAYIQAWVYGIFVPLVEGNAYSNYLPQKHDLDDIQADPHRDLVLTFDFNVSPLAFVVCQDVAFETPYEREFKTVAIDEANANKGSTLDDACAEFAAKFPVFRFGHTPITIYGDAGGYARSVMSKERPFEKIKRILNALGFKNVRVKAHKHNPLETVSVEALNSWFLDDELLICKRCIELRRSLVSTSWKPGTRNIDKPKGETWTHHAEALKAYAFARQNKSIITGVNA